MEDCFHNNLNQYTNLIFIIVVGSWGVIVQYIVLFRALYVGHGNLSLGD